MGIRSLTLTTLCLLFFIHVNAQLSADFVANTQTGCDFAQINFTNTTTDGGNSINCSSGYTYAWDFSPGSSSQCSPGNIFSTPGVYTICLTVTNNNTGESDTECKQDYITIYTLPQPSFTSSPQSGCEPLEVCFQNTSTLDQGSFTNCIWDFGDGQVTDDCTTSQICHTYAQNGSYTVTLTVIDDNGCAPVTATNTIDVFAAAEVDVTSDVTFGCSPPLTVNFFNNTVPTNGVDFEWTFEGANTTSFTGVTPPPITWSTEGSYDVTIISESANGCTDTLFLEDYIGVGSSIDFSVSDYSICLGDTVFFNDLSGGTPLSWQWDFGDGSGNASFLENPFYVYQNTGCFSVSLTTDNGGCQSTLTDPVCIQVSDIPTVSFTNDNPIGCELPHTVNFNVVGTDPAGSIFWIFGADTLGSSNQPTPTFTFNEFGNFPVTLEYTSPDGCQTSFTDNIQIEEIQVDLLGSSVEGCAPITVTLQDNVTSISPINDWVWTIPGIGTFNEENPTITATDTGSYDVILQVTNNLGCVALDTIEDYIQTGAPQMVEFSADPTLACIDTTIFFTDMSSPFVDQWFWQFGDGPNSFSFEQNPGHDYIDTGFFEVCLTVFQNGCESTLCKPDYIYTLPPRAALLFENECEDPFFYEFTDNSLAADSIFWDFGDPTTTSDVSSDSLTSYTYPGTGSYLVTLVSYNFTTGCTDTARQQIIVADPMASFTIPDTLGCAPFVVNPIDASIDAVAWEWTTQNGNITDENTAFPTIEYTDGGLYSNDIQLVVTDINGCMDTMVLSQDIYVNEVDVDFIIPESVGCAPFSLTLTDNSTSLFGNLTTWTWNDFQGNNAIGPDSEVTFVFTQADTFDIRLIVEDDLGCQGLIRHFDTIVVTNPVALFSSDTFACTEQVISFNNLSTGEGLSYAWDFGDLTVSSDPNPTHFYTTEGVYNACLTITDVNGCDSTFCNTITVADPVADFIADTTFAFCPPLIVNFTNLSQNAVPGGSTWDFGDGTGSSSADSPSHVYTQAGVFDVTLIVTNASGCQDTIVFDNYIELQGPVGDFTFTPDEGCAPVTVTFTTTSVLPSLHIMDYGDGSIDSSATAVTTETFVYTYTQAGDYTPALILVDDLGCDQVFDADSSIVVESLEVDFIATDTLLCDGGLTSFTSLVASSEPLTFLEWTFEGQTPATSTDLNPVNVMYNNNGQYDVQLTVSNGVCTDSLIIPDYIAVEPTPVASFTANPTTGCENLTVDFTDASTVTSGAITDWNWDFGDTNGSDQQNPTHIFGAAGTYNVELEISTINGCRDTFMSSIDILPTPDVETGTVTSICIGESVALPAQLNTDPTGVVFSWDNAGSLSCSDCITPIASPVVTTTYMITATAPNGCIDTASVTVTVIPFPVPDIGLGLDTTICEGTTIQLIASGGTSDPTSYQWDQANAGLSCYACPNPFANPAMDTEYTVTVTGPGGCVASDTINVSVFDPSQVFAGPDLTICEGESIVLSDGGIGTNPEWSPVSTLSCAFCPNPTASPNTTTTYAITIDDPIQGCRITDSVTVNVIPQGAIDAGVGSLICSGDPVQLNGSGPGTLVWSPGAFLDDPFIADPTAVITQNTTFILTATSGNCILTDSVTFEVTDSVAIVVNDAFICEGDSVQLMANGNGQSYTWSPATGLDNPNIQNPVAMVSETTTYTVSATFGSCPSNVAEATVTVNPLPEASILPIHNYYPTDPVELFVEQDPGLVYAYDWSPSAGLSCDDCQVPLAVPDTNTVYQILVTDTNTGCQTLLFTELRELGVCSESVLGVPNAFTPNNDGNNDVLYVRSTAVSDIRVFRVFDRWGALVFESNNISVGWDGTYDGKPVNPGVYVYYVEAFCPLDGSRILKKGNVTVIK